MPDLEPREGYVIRECDSADCSDQFYARPESDDLYCPPCVYEDILLRQAAG